MTIDTRARRRIRVLWRGICVALHVSIGLVLVLAVSMPGGWRLPRERLTRWWNTGLLQLLHVRIRQRGHPPTTAHLMVANHVSWLDISIIVASVETRFVSKAEVRSWPLAGWLATAAGTFYLQRGAGKTRTLVWALRDHLRNAGHVTIFPEGTTTEGERLLRFQSRLFAAAIDADCGVQPIALSYGRAASGENIAAFVGQQSLVANLWRLLQERELTVEVTFCTPLAADHADRGTLALSAHCAIAAALELTAPHESVQATPLAA